MATADLKKSVLYYIDNADDRLLKMIKALAETYQEEEPGYKIPQWHQEILDDRLKIYKENPDLIMDWDEVKEIW